MPASKSAVMTDFQTALPIHQLCLIGPTIPVAQSTELLSGETRFDLSLGANKAGNRASEQFGIPESWCGIVRSHLDAELVGLGHRSHLLGKLQESFLAKDRRAEASHNTTKTASQCS